MKHLTIFLFAFLLFNCKNETKTKIKSLTADEIVNKAIAVSGGNIFNPSTVVNIDFDFRNGREDILSF